MMFKKVVLALFLCAVVFAPVSSAAASPKTFVLIEDIQYSVKDVPLPDYITDQVKGPILYAEGEGVINCNGVEACQAAGLHGATVTIQQGFAGMAAAAGVVTARTAGRILLPGELPAISFRGKGDGTAECSEGTCHLTMTFDARAKRGAKVIVTIHIDHTSAGFADTFEGSAIIRQ